MSLTYSDVDNICTQLSVHGKDKITTRMIREELGRGSLSTISKHIKAWKAQYTSSQSNVHRLQLACTASENTEQIECTRAPVRKNKSTKQIHQIPECRVSFLSNCIHSILLTTTVAAVTFLLINMQYTAYQKEGVPFALWLSVLTEIAMILLVGFPFRGLKKVLAALTCGGLFVYCLGLLSFDLVNEKERKIETMTLTSSEQSSLKESIALAQQALALAIEKKESGNVAKLSKVLETLSVDQRALSAKDVGTPKTALTEYKFNGLVFLRALLMIFNLLLVHSLVDLWRKDVNRNSVRERLELGG